MRRFTLAAMVLLCAAGSLAADEPAPADDTAATADGTTETTSADNNAAADIDGETDSNGDDRETALVDGAELELAYEGQADGNSIKEFIPADETLETWTRLVGVREYSDADDPKKFVEGVIENLKTRNPPTSYDLLENDKNGDVIIDFIVWPEDVSFAEFNVFQYRKKPEGGLISYQYAVRAYGDDVVDFINGMNADKRTKLIADLLRYVNEAQQ